MKQNNHGNEVAVIRVKMIDFLLSRLFLLQNLVELIDYNHQREVNLSDFSLTKLFFELFYGLSSHSVFC